MKKQFKYQAIMYFTGKRKSFTDKIDFDASDESVALAKATEYLVETEGASAIHFRKVGNRKWRAVNQSEVMSHDFRDMKYYINYVTECIENRRRPMTFEKYNGLLDGENCIMGIIN